MISYKTALNHINHTLRIIEDYQEGRDEIQVGERLMVSPWSELTVWLRCETCETSLLRIDE